MQSNGPILNPYAIRPGVIALSAIAVAAIVITLIGLNFDLFNVWDVITLFIWFLAASLPIAAILSVWSRSVRRRRRITVLGYVEDAIRLNLPLPAMILAASNSESGMLRYRLLDLHDGLSQGLPLDHALRGAVPEIPKRSIAAINAAMRMGCLPQTLRRMVRRNMPHEPPATNLDGFYRGYMGVVLLVVLTFIAFIIGVFVMPKFLSMLAADHLQLPWAARLFLAVSQSYGPLVIIGLLLATIFIPWLGSARDYLIWWIPVAGSASRDKSTAELCDFLVDALELGQPMDAALVHAAQAQPNAVLRGRAHIWANALASGQSPRDAARHAHMPALMTAMLNTVRGGEDLIQVLAFLARHYESRFSRARELLRTVAMPAFVFCMGGAVLLVCLSVFQPLLLMIQYFSPNIGGF